MRSAWDDVYDVMVHGFSACLQDVFVVHVIEVNMGIIFNEMIDGGGGLVKLLSDFNSIDYLISLVLLSCSWHKVVVTNATTGCGKSNCM